MNHAIYLKVAGWNLLRAAASASCGAEWPVHGPFAGGLCFYLAYRAWLTAIGRRRPAELLADRFRRNRSPESGLVLSGASAIGFLVDGHCLFVGPNPCAVHAFVYVFLALEQQLFVGGVRIVQLALSSGQIIEPFREQIVHSFKIVMVARF